VRFPAIAENTSGAEPVYLFDRRTGTAALQPLNMTAMGHDVIVYEDRGRKMLLDLTRIP
jgi:hypothetical protein